MTLYEYHMKKKKEEEEQGINRMEQQSDILENNRNAEIERENRVQHAEIAMQERRALAERVQERAEELKKQQSTASALSQARTNRSKNNSLIQQQATKPITQSTPMKNEASFKANTIVNDAKNVLKNFGIGVAKTGTDAMRYMDTLTEQAHPQVKQNQYLGETVKAQKENNQELKSYLDDAVEFTTVNGIPIKRINYDKYDSAIARQDEAIANKLNYKIQENIESSNSKVGKKLAEMAPSMGNSLATGLLSAVNPALGQGAFISSASGSYLDDAKQRGLTGKKASAYAGAMGMAEAITELVGGELAEVTGKRFGLDMPSGDMMQVQRRSKIVQALAKSGKNELGRSLAKFGIDVGENFIEEAMMNPINDFASRALGGSYEKDASKVVTSMLEDGLNGALQSIIMGGTEAGVAKAVNITNKIQKGQNVTVSELADAIKETHDQTGLDYESIINQNVNNVLAFANKSMDEQKTVKDLIKEIDDSNYSKEIKQSMKTDLQNGIDFNTYTKMRDFLANRSQKQKAEQVNTQVSEQVNQTENNTAQNQSSEQTRTDRLNRYLTSAKNAQLDPNNDSVRQIYGLAQRRGIDVEYDANKFKNNNQNAFYSKDGKIYINPNSDTDLTLQNLAIHELTHSMEGTDDYKALKKIVLDYANKVGKEDFQKGLQELSSLYEKEYDKNSADFNTMIEEEAVANILGEKLGDDTFINELVNGEYSAQNKNVVQKIYDWIKNQINKLTGYKNEQQYWQNVKEKFDKAFNKELVTENQNNKFSTELSDIKDSQGKQLSQGQVEYFKDSKVRNQDGSLIPVYHGTSNKGFTEFRRNANFYTDSKDVANTYTGNDGIYEGYVDIKNPITINANKELWSMIDIDNIQIDGIDNIKAFLDKYGASTWKEKGKIRTSTADLVSAISEARDEGEINADGIIIKDIYDEGSRGQKGTLLANDYVTFDSNQFKNADNLNPTESPDIRYSKENVENGKENYRNIIEGNKSTNGKTIERETFKNDNDISTIEFIQDKYKDVVDHLILNEKENTINLDNLVVKKDKRNQGIGQQILNDIIKYADENNKTITLTPTTEFNTKNKLKQWYKNNGFVENKGRNTDFLIRDTMYRKPNGNKYSLENNKTLLAQHNLTEDKLKGVLDLGGFPVPSIAITNQPHTGFGDISVIFDKDTIDPSNNKNEVYDRDVWSPTFPQVDYVIDTNLSEDIAKNLGLKEWELNDYAEDANNPDDLVSKLLRNKKEIIDKFIEDNKLKYETKYRDQDITKWYNKQDSIKDFIKNNNVDMDSFIKDSDLRNKYYEALRNEFNKDSDEIEAINKQIENIEYRANNDSQWLRDSTLKNDFETINGKSTVVDDYETNKEKYKIAKENGIEDYLKAQINPMFGERGIRNDRDTFKPDGSRRSFWQLHDQYNLENLVRALTNKDTVGSQNSFMTGFGKINAQMSQKFNSIEEIKSAENRLMSDEDNENIEKYRDILGDDISDLSDYYKHEDSFGMQGFTNASESLFDLAKSGDLTEDNFKKILEENVIDSNKVPKELINKIIDDLNNLKELGTDYFEAKPQRAVGLNEVKALVVPSDIDADLKQQLLDKGLNVIEYDRNKEGDREAKINALEDLKFSNELGGAWRSFLDKYIKGQKNKGETLKQIRVPQMSLNEFTDIVDKANIPTEYKNMLKETVLTEDFKRTKQSFEDFKNEIHQMEQAYSETLVEKPKIPGKKEKVKELYKYKNAKGDYDTKYFDNAYKLVPQTRAGNITINNWLNVAKQMGTAMAKLSDEQISEIGARSWFDNEPYRQLASADKKNWSRSGSGFATDNGTVFNLTTWVDTIQKSAEEQRNKFSLENQKEEIKVPKAEPVKETAPEAKSEFDEDLEAFKEETRLVSEKGKGRKHYKTYSQVADLSQKDRNTAKKLFNTERYIPISNNRTLENANSRINRIGIDDLYNDYNERISKGEEMTLDDIGTMERMIQIYSDAKDHKKVNELMQNVAILGTELGQRVQALSIIKRATPEGQLRTLQRLIQRTNAKEGTDIKLTDAQVEKILNSNDSKETEANVTKVVEELAQQTKVTMKDEIRAWRYLSMLGNPRTHIRNIVGNVFMDGLQVAKNKVAGVGQDFAGIFNKNLEKTSSLRMANSDQRAFAKEDAFKMIDYIDGKMDLEQLLQKERRTSKIKPLNAIEKFNSNLLENEDAFFLQKAYKQAMQSYMSANKLSSEDLRNDDKKLQRARQYAIDQAQQATFHQYNALANSLNQIEQKGGVGGALVSAILPFKKTPMNIAKTGLEYSPAGIATSVGGTIKDIASTKKNLDKQLKNGDLTKQEYNYKVSDMVNKRIDQMAKGLTGTSIAVLGYALANMGIIKGTNKDDEDEFDSSLGKQEFSVQIGDNTYSLDWLAPTAIPLFVGANIAETIEKAQNGEEVDGINAIATSILQSLEPMTEMSMLQGVASALSSYEQDSSSKLFDIGASALTSYASQFIPTALGQVTKTIDPTVRDTSSTKKGLEGKLDRLKNQTMSKIPGLSEQLPAKKDVWGEDKQRNENPILRLLENAVVPYNREKVIDDATTEALKEVYEDSGEKVFPGTPNKSITINKEKYDLNNKEYNESKALYGKTAKSILDKMLTSSDFKKLSDEEKVKAIKSVYDYSKEVIKEKVGKDNNNPYESQQLNAVKGLTNVAEKAKYFTYKAITSKDDLKDNDKKKLLKDSNLDNKSKEAIYSSTLGKSDKVYNNIKQLDNKFDINAYLDYKIQDFKSDEDESSDIAGKVVSGSKKDKVINYINNSNLSDVSKMYLYGTSYKLSNSEQNYLTDYFNSHNFTDEQIKEFIKGLASSNYVEYKDGSIRWK